MCALSANVSQQSNVYTYSVCALSAHMLKRSDVHVKCMYCVCILICVPCMYAYSSVHLAKMQRAHTVHVLYVSMHTRLCTLHVCMHKYIHSRSCKTPPFIPFTIPTHQTYDMQSTTHRPLSPQSSQYTV